MRIWCCRVCIVVVVSLALRCLAIEPDEATPVSKKTTELLPQGKALLLLEQVRYKKINDIKADVLYVLMLIRQLEDEILERIRVDNIDFLSAENGIKTEESRLIDEELAKLEVKLLMLPFQASISADVDKEKSILMSQIQAMKDAREKNRLRYLVNIRRNTEVEPLRVKLSLLKLQRNKLLEQQLSIQMKVELKSATFVEKYSRSEKLALESITKSSLDAFNLLRNPKLPNPNPSKNSSRQE